jgi:enoyl-CoA hydratase/carnithine racemase
MRSASGARLVASKEVDVRTIKSLAARKQLFDRQFSALEKSLAPLTEPRLAAAVMPSRNKFELREDVNGSVWVFLRTGPGNTFDAVSLRTLVHVVSAVRNFANFSRLKTLYLSHMGKDFSLGGHRRFFAEELENGRKHSIVEIGEIYKEFLKVLGALPCVTVGIAYGSAQGGGMELLMSLDHQIVWPGVKLGFPEVRTGFIAGMGGISYLSSIVGPQRALQMNIEGALIESEEAVRLGIISEVSQDPFASALAFDA